MHGKNGFVFKLKNKKKQTKKTFVILVKFCQL